MLTPTFLNLPEDIYISEEDLEKVVIYGVDNFCMPDEALIENGYSARFYKYWILLAKAGDGRAQRIIDYLDSIPKKWLRQTRKRILQSNDMRSVSTTYIYLEDKVERTSNNDEVGDIINDEWV